MIYEQLSKNFSVEFSARTLIDSYRSQPLMRILEDDAHEEHRDAYRKNATYWMSGWNQELPQGISQAQWLHNTTMLVTGTSQGNVVLWDVVSGNPLYKRLVGHKSKLILR